jgi:hypothetical protein
MFRWFRRPSRRPLLASGLAALFLLGQTSPAWAWGRNGHRIVAKFAQTRLNSAARAAILDILEDGEDIADASTWPDEHKSPHDAPWHYVNVPIDQNAYDDQFCDSQKGCVVEKIKEFRKVLKDPSAGDMDKRRALRFLVHLVGDIHQPLHVGDHNDRGANQVHVRYFQRGTNLHNVWDDQILFFDPSKDQDDLGDPTVDEGAWVTRLVKFTDDTKAAAWSGTTKPEDWATESLRFAKKAYHTNPDDDSSDMITSGTRLGDEYEAAGIKVVELRLAQAGVRLANVLNELFPDNR